MLQAISAMKIGDGYGDIGRMIRLEEKIHTVLQRDVQK